MISRKSRLALFGVSFWALVLSACSERETVTEESQHQALAGVVESAVSDPDTGIRLPDGFSATIFADAPGSARHMAVSSDGWVYAALFRPTEDGMGAVALRDTDGDGAADERHYFGEGLSGTGMHLAGDWLYFGADDRILRFPVSSDAPIPTGAGELVVGGFPEQRQHASKPIAFDDAGFLYVNMGVPSNNCMRESRTKGSPGMDPCPILDTWGGIYRFRADQTDQSFSEDGERYSTGHRNVNALDWNPSAGALYLAQHGRDQLGQFFPDLYDDEASARLPAEEFHRVDRGDDLGWPYSYFDQDIGERIVSPEYGGDGKTVSDRGQDPLIGFPGHWAPNDLLFKQNDAWGDAWTGGAFIAFHGSWNRAPRPQAGYRVVYVPMTAEGEVAGEWITFADGFPGKSEIKSPRDADHRPTGLAEGPDGALYISSMVKGGRIWRVTPAANDGPARDAVDTDKASLSTEVTDELTSNSEGAKLYADYCGTCHQADGSGVPFLQPALINSARANGEKGGVIAMILWGSDAVPAGTSEFSNAMPGFGELEDDDIAALATYVRTQFENSGGPVTADDVGRIRSAGVPEN